MTNCKAKNKNGKYCQAKPKAGESYCFAHNPKVAKERALARRRGGSSHKQEHGGNFSTIPNQITTIQDARQILSYVIEEILPMENTIPRARVLIQLFDSYVKSIESSEIENRLSILESRQ